MKIAIMHFSLASCYFFLHGYKEGRSEGWGGECWRRPGAAESKVPKNEHFKL